MPTITTAMKMYDGMSPVFRGITTAMNITISSMQRLHAASGNMVEVKNLNAARESLAESTAELLRMQEREQATAQAQKTVTNNMRDGVSAAAEMAEQVSRTNSEMGGVSQKTKVVLDQTQQIVNGTKKLTPNQNNFGRSLSTSSTIADGLWLKLKGIAATYLGMQGVRKIIDISDDYTAATSAVNLINDGSKTTAEFMDQIYQAAQRSRAPFTEMAQSVAELKNATGNLFKNNDELLKFDESLQKMFSVTHTPSQAAQNATIQMEQAMAVGTLRGQDYRSVVSQAPIIEKALMKYEGIQNPGQLKQMAEQGKLSAQTVKNAILSYYDEISGKLNKVPYTFSQIATSIKNYSIKAFEPALQKLQQFSNSKTAQEFAARFVLGIQSAANAAEKLLEIAAKVGNFIGQNWKTISPVIWGIVGALSGYRMSLLLVNAQKALATVSEAVHARAILANAAAYDEQTLAMARNAVTQANAVKASIKFSLITAVVAAALAFAINYVGGLTNALRVLQMAIGVAGTWFQWLGMSIYNVAATGSENLQTLADFVRLMFQTMAYGIRDNFVDAIAGAVKVVQDGVNVMAKPINAVLSVINKLKGTHYQLKASFADTTQNWAKSITAQDKQKLTQSQRELVQNAVNRSQNQAKRTQDVNNQALAASKAGERLVQTVQSMHAAASKSGSTSQLDKIIQQLKGSGESNKNIADNTAATASNTSKSTEDLKYMRDLAEKKAINRLTTANVTVHMGGVTQNLASDMDIDGAYEKMTRDIYKVASSGAEGVHRS